MKRSYLLLGGLILSSSILFAQRHDTKALQYKGELVNDIETPQEIIKTPGLIKAFKDTVHLETFNTSLNGWTVGNNTGNSNNWMWHNAAPGGQYTSEPMIASTSGPGFLALRMDYLNTPIPAGGAATMDAWVTSPKITIPALKSVYVQFEQSFRYCCQGTNQLNLEVSTDGVNFTAYDVKGGRGANTVTPNPEIKQVNVSDVLANQTEVYLRFRAEGSSHYYWMVDDVAILEGPENAVALEHFAIGYHSDNYEYTPNYGMYPLEQASGAFSVAYLRNMGSKAATNVETIVEFSHDSTLSGAPGTGLVYTADSLISTTLPSLGRDTGLVGLGTPFFASETGYHSFNYSVASDSVNELPIEEQTGKYKFIVSDSVYALETGTFGGHGGPGGYVGAGIDGDKVAQLFIIENTTWATSISLAIPARAEMHGIKIIPFIYKFEEDTFLNAPARDLTALRKAISSAPIYSEFFPITVDTNTMGGRWNSFKFAQRVKLDPGAYYVGIEQSEGQNAGKQLFLYRSVEAEKHANALSALMDLQGGTNPGWSSIPHILGLRLNVGPETVGIDKQEMSNTEFEVSPNPTSGDFKMYLNSKELVRYKLTINNMLGQEVYTEDISVNGAFVKDLSLEGLDKGVYFVNLVNGNESLVKKIVLN